MMSTCSCSVHHIWLRAETKPNEQRRALTPDKCQELIEKGFQVSVEYSDQSVFKNEEYQCIPGINMVQAGSWVHAPNDVIVLGLKELPQSDDPVSHRHIYFAHAYKNQTGWATLLHRFIKGGGSILDIEFMTDEKGRRVVAEFSGMAGLGGMGLGILAWCHQQFSPDKPMGEVKPYGNEAAFIDHIALQIKQVAELKDCFVCSASFVLEWVDLLQTERINLEELLPNEGCEERYVCSHCCVQKVFPRIMVIGALGRCGRRASEIAYKLGIPKSSIAEWDVEETEAGGPFEEILNYDILINCILLTEKIPPFLTKKMLEREDRNLSVVVDVSCDPNNPYNPLPFYNATTSFDKPCDRIRLRSVKKLDVIAIDHLPSVLPRESSQRFANKMTPYLLRLSDDPVWNRTERMFEKKAAEVKALLNFGYLH